EVVAGQAAEAHNQADPATEREPGDSRVDERPARHGEAMRLRRGVELLPVRPGSGAGPTTHRIDDDAPHPAEIDDQAVVDQPVAGDAVAATADPDREVVLAREPDGPTDFRVIGRLGDHRRSPIDHRVERAAGVVVCGTAGLDDLAREAAPKLVDGALLDDHSHPLDWAAGPPRVGPSSEQADDLSLGVDVDVLAPRP